MGGGAAAVETCRLKPYTSGEDSDTIFVIDQVLLA